MMSNGKSNQPKLDRIEWLWLVGAGGGVLGALGMLGLGCEGRETGQR